MGVNVYIACTESGILVKKVFAGQGIPVAGVVPVVLQPL
jgi:hypothetical protein